MKNNYENKRFMKIFGIYLALLMLFVVVRLGAGYGWFSNIGDEIATDAVSTAVIQIGIMFLVPFILYMAFFHKTPKQTFSDFKFKRIGIKAVLICILLGVLGYIINLYASTFFATILSRLGYNFSYSSGDSYSTLPKFLFGVVSVAILPGFCEEFAHRGLLLQGTRKVWGYKMAIVVSSICFGLMHLNIQQVFFATVLGVFMAYTDISAGSIIPSIIMHFMNNFINVFMSFGQSTGFIKFSLSGLLSTIYSKSVVLFVVFVSVILFLALIAFAGLIKLLHKVSLQNKDKQKLSTQTKVQNLQESNAKSLQNGIQILGDATIDGNSQIDDIYKQQNNSTERQNPKTLKEWTEMYVAPSDSKKLDVPFVEKIPFIMCLFLSIMVTAFTFVWGVV